MEAERQGRAESPALGKKDLLIISGDGISEFVPLLAQMPYWMSKLPPEELAPKE